MCHFKPLAFALILCARTFIQAEEGTDDACPDRCTCDWAQFHAKCSNMSRIPVFAKNCSSLLILDLDNNSIESITRQDFKCFTSLQDLILSKNHIKIIENETFADLIHINTIRLNWNAIEIIHSDAFVHQPTLNILEISHNNISTDSFLWLNMLPGLTILNLAYNHIPNITMGSVPKLVSLNLEQNLISNVPRNLCEKAPSIKTLHLDNNKLTEIEDGDFNRCFTLSELYLHNNYIRKLGNHVFTSNASIPNKSLLTLLLNNNYLSSIPQCVLGLQMLHTLDVSVNPIVELNRHNFTGLSQLSHLSASYMPLLSSIGKEAFTDMTSLTRISMCCNSNLTYIAGDAFAGLNRLHNVRLDNNSMVTFPESLLPWSQIRIVDIQGNPLLCDCRLSWMLQGTWESASSRQMYKSLQCSQPKQLKSRFLHDVSFIELGCHQPEHKTYTNRVVTGLVFAAVGLLVIVLVGIFFKFRRNLMIRWKYYRYARQSDEGPFSVENEFSDYPNTDIPGSRGQLQMNYDQL